MNILSIYFSGTNNTKYISNKLKEKTNKNNTFNEIDLGNPKLNIENIVFENYDFLILGAPVYIEAYPNIFTDFIKTYLKNISNKKIILYQTSASPNPPAIYETYNFFRKNNEIVCMTTFQMINNFYMNGMFKYTHEDLREGLILECDKKINEIALILNNSKDKYITVSLRKRNYLIGKTLYKILNKTYLKNYPLKNFNSNNECTGCEICKNNCPVANIEVDKNKKSIRYFKNCIGCMKCIHICPNNAILFKNEKIKNMNMLS